MKKYLAASPLANTILIVKSTLSYQFLSQVIVVDTEGHDYEIIMDLDLNILKPKTITFENSHMDGTFVTGERYHRLMEHFSLNGYTKFSEDKYDTTIKLTE